MCSARAFLLLLLAWCVAGSPVQSPFLISESFVSTATLNDVALDSGGSVTSGCGLIGGTTAQQAFFAGPTPGTRSLITSPVGVTGVVRVSFGIYGDLLCSGSINTLYDSVYVQATSGGSFVNLSSVTPLTAGTTGAYFSRTFTNTYQSASQPAPGALWRIIQGSSPNDATNRWGLDNLDMTCEALVCASDTGATTLLTQNFDVSTGSLTISGGSRVATSLTQCALSGTGSLWMRDAAGSRSVQLPDSDLSTGGLLQFDINVPTYCPPPISLCNCSNKAAAFWINEVVANPLRLDYVLNTSVYGNITRNSSFAFNFFYFAPNISTTGMGFEIAGTPGDDISGFRVIIIGQFQRNELDDLGEWNQGSNGRDFVGMDSWPTQTDDTRHAYYWIVDNFTLPAGSILRGSGTGTQVGYASFSYDFRKQAECIFAGQSPLFTGSSCQLLLFNPTATKLYHRFWIWPANKLSEVPSSYLSNSWCDIFGSNRNSGNPNPVVCVQNNSATAAWLSLTGGNRKLDCQVRIEGIAPSCTNCMEVTPNSRFDDYYDDWINENSAYNYTCNNSGFSPAQRFWGTDMSCASQTTYVGDSVALQAASYCVYAATGDCFTQDFLRTAGPCRRTLFSTDDSAAANLPNATSTPVYQTEGSGWGGFPSQLLSGGSAMTFSCAQSYTAPSLFDCCGVSKNFSFVELQGRPDGGANWRGIKGLTFDTPLGGETVGWQTHAVPIPPWMQSPTAQLRFVQTVYAGSVATGDQSWGVDNIRLTDFQPRASAAGFALELAPGNGAALTTSFSAGDPITVFFYFKSSSTSSETLFTSAALNISRTPISMTFTAQCAPTVINSVPFSPVADRWFAVSVMVSNGANRICVNSTCSSGTDSCTLPAFTSVLLAPATASLTVDELRIFRTAVPETTVANTATRLLTAAEQSSLGLVSRWSFDEGACGSLGVLPLARSSAGTLTGSSQCRWRVSGAPLAPYAFVDRSTSTSVLIDMGQTISSDAEDPTLRVRVTAQPPCGLLELSPGVPLTLNANLAQTFLSYTPSAACPNAYTDSFPYEVLDSRSAVSAGSYNIEVTAAPAALPGPPVSVSYTYYYLDTSSLVVLDASSYTGTSIFITSGPTTDSVLVDASDAPFPVPGPFTPGQVKYQFGSQIATNFNVPPARSDSFVYAAASGGRNSSTAVVSIVRRAPLAVADVVSPAVNFTQRAVLLSDLLANDYYLQADASAGLVSIQSVGSVGSGGIDGATAQGGSVALASNTSVIYTLPSGFEGVDTFAYVLRLSQGPGYTSVAQVSVTVALNARPVPAPGGASTPENVDVGITLTGSSVYPADFVVASLPAAGELFQSLDGSTPQPALPLTAGDLPLVLSNNRLVYRPALNANGAVSFTFSMFDPTLGLASLGTATVTVTVTSVPTAPGVRNSTVVVYQATSTFVSLCPDEVIDWDGTGTVGCTVASLPSHGSLSCSGTPITVTPTNCSGVVYNPDPPFLGTDGFLLTAYDRTNGLSSTGGVFLSVETLNPLLPVTFDLPLNVTEDTPTLVNLSSVAAIAFGQLFYFLSSAPAQGALYETVDGVTPLGLPIRGPFPYTVLLNANGWLIYVPPANVSGPSLTVFGWYVLDDQFRSSAASVLVSVLPVPDEPVAQPATVYGVEDTPVNFTLVAASPDVGAALVLRLSFAGLNGALYDAASGAQLSSGVTTPSTTFTFAPVANWHGIDASLSYTVADSGSGLQSPAMVVTFNVSAANDPPVAVAQTVTTLEDSSGLLVLLANLDPDVGDAATYFVSEPLPAHGQLFNFDGFLPVGGALVNGSQLSRNGVVYVPDAEYSGGDAFAYWIRDGAGAVSNVATVTIVVQPLLDLPRAYSYSMTINEGSNATISLNASDPDTAVLSYVLTHRTVYPLYNSTGELLPAAAGAQAATQDVLYTPPARGLPVDYSLFVFDALAYYASAGAGQNSNEVVIYVHVVNLNDPPTASDGVYRGVRNVVVPDVRPVFDDPDLATLPQNLSLRILTLPSQGNLTTSAGAAVAAGQLFVDVQPDTPPVFAYYPSATGNYSFTFELWDGLGLSSPTATVWLLIAETDMPPVAIDVSAPTTEETAVDITLLASDDYSTALNFSIVSLANASGNGLLYDVAGSPLLIDDASLPFALRGAAVRFLPAVNFYGVATFYFAASDPYATSAPGLVTVTVANVDDPPVANPQLVVTQEAQTVSFSVSATSLDPPPDPDWECRAVSLPAHGSLSLASVPLTPATVFLASDTLEYTPAAFFFGGDSFTFQAAHPSGAYGPAATVRFAVYAVDNAPTALAQVVATNKTDPPLLITLAATDVDTPQSGLSFVLLTLPAQGQLYQPNPFLAGGPMSPLLGPLPLTLASPDVYYVPWFNATVVDAFTFVARDLSAQQSAPATVDIVIGPIDQPVAFPQTVVLYQDRSVNITLAGLDTQPAAALLAFTVDGAPSAGTLTLVAGSQTNTTVVYSYQPVGDYIGPDAFTFYVVDSTGVQSASATVSISVQPWNNAPTALDGRMLVQNAENTTVIVNATDVDNAIAYYVLVTLPPKGKVYWTDGTPVLTPGQTIQPPGSNAFLVEISNENSVAGLTSLEFVAVDALGAVSLTPGVIVFDVEGAQLPPVVTPFSLVTTINEGLRVDVTSSAVDPNAEQVFYNVSVLPTPATGTLYFLNTTLNGPDTARPVAVSDLITVVWFQPATDFFCQTFFCTGFSYEATDNKTAPQPGEVKIDVQPISTPPEINPAAFSSPQLLVGFEDTPLVLPFESWILAAGGRTLVFQVQSIPTFGQIWESSDCNSTTSSLPVYTITTPCAIYIPNPNYNSPPADSFSWQAIDTFTQLAGPSPPASVVVQTTPVNDLPVPNSLIVSGSENQFSVVVLGAFDADGDPLTFVIARSPISGSLYQYCDVCSRNEGPRIVGSRTVVSDVNNRVVYEPPPGQYGQNLDSFDFRPCDPLACGGTSTVIVDIARNAFPVPQPQSVDIDEDTLTAITLTGSDGNGDKLTAIISFLPLVGKLYQIKSDGTRGSQIQVPGTTVTDPNNRVFYLPPLNANGPSLDSFGFRMFDGLDQSSGDATVTISVTPVDDDPIVRQIAVTGALENDPLTIIIGGTSPDGNTLRSILTSPPQNGVLLQAPSSKMGLRDTSSDLITEYPAVVTDPRGKVIYQPNQFWNGWDFFSFYVEDVRTSLRSDVSNVTVQVVPVNNRPSVENLEISIPPVTFEPFKIIVTDVDSPLSSLQLQIDTLPESGTGSIYQSDDTGTSPAEEIFSAGTLVTNRNFMMFVRSDTSIQGRPYNITFTYSAIDDFGAVSNTGYFFANVSTYTPPSNGGLPIGAVAGIGAGVGAGVLCLAGAIYWYYKKRSKDVHSVAGSLVQRRSSKDLLEKLLLEPDHQVVKALAQAIDISEADGLAQALVDLFASNGAIIPLLKAFIRIEVRDSNNPSTLFRSNSLASKMMKVYSRKVGEAYLRHVLQPLVLEIISRPGEFEVNAAKLSAGQSLDMQWETLTTMTSRVLAAILDSAAACPMEFRKLCSYLQKEIAQQFPGFGNAHTFTGGFLFLRFFCPAIVAPEVYGLTEEPPSMSARRGLILVSKALQNLSNGVQFGHKEEYMMPMNGFIVENLHRLKTYLVAVAEFPKGQPLNNGIDVSHNEKLDALDLLHQYLFVHQEQVCQILEMAGTGDEYDRSYQEHLASLEYLTSHAPHMIEEITDSLISSVPLVSIFCSGIPKGKDGDEIVTATLTIMEDAGQTIELLTDLIEREIKDCSNGSALMKGDSPAMRMCKDYINILSLNYFQQVISFTIRLIANDAQGFEIDPSKVSDHSLLQRNVERLTASAQEILANLYGSVHSMPPQVRLVLFRLFIRVQESQFSDRRMTTIAELLFNRVISPAIVTPFRYNLVDEPPSPEATRALLLTSKLVNAAAHSKPFPDSDFMSQLNGFVHKNTDKMQEYLSKLVDIPEGYGEDTQGFLITGDVLENSVRIVHSQFCKDQQLIRQKLIPDARDTGTARERLAAILLDMGPPVQVGSRRDQPGREAAD